MQRSNLMAALSLAERIDQFAGEGEPGRESVQTIRQHAEQVRAVIDGPATIRVDATIDRNCNWTHRPARRTFSFIDMSGVLTEFDIRCARVGAKRSSLMKLKCGRCRSSSAIAHSLCTATQAPPSVSRSTPAEPIRPLTPTWIDLMLGCRSDSTMSTQSLFFRVSPLPVAKM